MYNTLSTDLNHLGGAEALPVERGNGAGDTFVHDASLETLKSGQVTPQLRLLLASGSE